jgi:hypothetical protein
MHIMGSIATIFPMKIEVAFQQNSESLLDAGRLWLLRDAIRGRLVRSLRGEGGELLSVNA